MTADTGLLRRPVNELTALVRGGELSAQELVETSLAVIEERDAALHAFVSVDPDRALADAAAVDRIVAAGDDPGPLAGLPIGVKDLDDAAGFVTTHGSAVRRNDPPASADSAARGPI